MDKKDKCIKLEVIPQYGGSCWFNAILMIALYSQLTRKVLIKASKYWNKDESFHQILKSILLKYYREPEKVQEFFSKVKPEYILFKLAKISGDYALMNALREGVKKNIANIGSYENYIANFFKFLKINCLEITYINNEYFFNLYDEIQYVYDKQLNYYDITLKNPNENIHTAEKRFFKETSEILKKVPDIIFVMHEKINQIAIDFKRNKDIKNLKSYSSQVYNCKIQGVDTFDNYIYVNGHKYKLDATTLTNYNNAGHAIAGITCNNERYVYNGWQKKTKDPAFRNYDISFDVKDGPCALMKYDWDLKKDKSFCLNSKTCKLDFVENPDDLCFSFGIDNKEGRRYLVYVRVKEYEKMKTTEEEAKLSIPENLKISGVSDIIKDIHDIKNLTNEELIEQLGKLGIALVPDFPYDKQTLQGLLYDALAEYYDISPEIIQEFRKKRTTPVKRELKKIKKYHYSGKEEEEEDEEDLDKKPMKKLEKARKEEEYDLKEKINLQRQLEKQLKTITKDDLIKKILSKYPYITGITSKNKLELLEILIYGESLEKDMKNKNRIPKYKSKDELIAILIKKLPKLTKTKMEELISII